MKTIQYKDQYLTMMHYKEPLKEISEGEGFGYYGCLLGTTDGQKVQCAICGGFYESLAMHVYQTHEMRARAYKEKFQLAYRTGLVSSI